MYTRPFISHLPYSLRSLSHYIPHQYYLARRKEKETGIVYGWNRRPGPLERHRLGSSPLLASLTIDDMFRRILLTARDTFGSSGSSFPGFYAGFSSANFESSDLNHGLPADFVFSASKNGSDSIYQAQAGDNSTSDFDRSEFIQTITFAAAKSIRTSTVILAVFNTIAAFATFAWIIFESRRSHRQAACAQRMRLVSNGIYVSRKMINAYDRADRKKIKQKRPLIIRFFSRPISFNSVWIYYFSRYYFCCCTITRPRWFRWGGLLIDCPVHAARYVLSLY